MRKFKISICGEPWIVRVMPEVEFKLIHHEQEFKGTEGITAKPYLDFAMESICLGNIRHEVRHAYLAECCIESTDISSEDMEEINATLDETKWLSMDKTSKSIHNRVKKYLNRPK